MVKIMNSQNGVEVSVFDNTVSPFTLDLYMRRFIGEKRRIQAFHAELTTEQARELIIDLQEKLNRCDERKTELAYQKYLHH
jgi:hypothetical protein